MTPRLRGARRVTLPPDSRSARLARRHVTSACEDAGLLDVLDDALLIVTELVTNAVVHAGTNVELYLDTSGPGLRGEVLDQGGGSLPVLGDDGPGDPAEATREGGRGLFLLDALASSWGTHHGRSGKSVWFRLDGDATGDPRPVLEPAAEPARVRATIADLNWLVELPDRLQERLVPDQLVGELLHRLCDGVDVDQAVILSAATDGDEDWAAIARVGPALPDELEVHAQALAIGTGARVVAEPGLLVLPLHGVVGASGAVVLRMREPDQEPDSTDQALSRLVADRVGVSLGQERLREARRRSRGSLALLAEASDMFAGSLDVTLAVTLLAQLVVPRFGRWAAVFDLTEQAPRLLSVAHADEDEAPTLRVLLSSSDSTDAAERVAERLEPHRPTLLRADQLPPAVRGLHDGDVLAVPLVARRRLLGMLLLSTSGAAGAGDEASLLLDLARRAAVAMDTARLYEERNAVAQALQASLLPPALPAVPDLQFGARYAAAGEGNEVGGDFYDVFPMNSELGDCWAVAIGDVCGKGAEAAAITGLARNVLRLFSQEGRTPEQVFRRLNEAILDLGERGRFCTTALAVLRPSPSGLQVEVASAGHPPAALVRADGTVRLLGSGGTLLGVTPDIEVLVEHLVLAPGEHLVFYTDGVTERRNGGLWFGEDNLLDVLSRAAGRSADVVAGMLEESVRAFASAAASDDMAVLVVGPSAAPVADPGRVTEALAPTA
ncbi:MAG: hypothetical protein JWN57_2276 [Frankiales bacterium]|nr:hypothetical protein [Frankiales bacterium]